MGTSDPEREGGCWVQGPRAPLEQRSMHTLSCVFAYVCTASFAKFEPRVWINGVMAEPDVLTAHAELCRFKKLNLYCREYFTNCLLSPDFLALVVNHTQFYFKICHSVPRFVSVDDRLTYIDICTSTNRSERGVFVPESYPSSAKAPTCSRSPAQTSTCCVNSC